MLKNGDFTQGWTDLPPAPGFLINQQPNHWSLTWLEPGQNLYDDPGSQARGVPECVHKLARQLPPHEQLGQPQALILAGDTTYKIFHAASTFGATLSQTVTGLEPGSSAVLTVPIQVHLHGATDPFSAESGVWVNGQGGWVSGGDMGDREWFRHVHTFTVPAAGVAEITIRVKSKWPQPKDFFIDGVTLEAAAGEPEEPEEPEEPTVLRQRIDLLDGSVPGRIRLSLKEKVGNMWVERGRLGRRMTGQSQLEIVTKREPAPKSLDDALALAEAPPAFALNEPAPNSPHRVLGMDVSWAQARTINFEKAAQMGVRFCFIRVASGKNEKDENFEHNYAEAGRVGMLRGIYYYLYPEAEATVGQAADRTPEGQARRFAALLKPDAELGAVLDVEDTDLTPGEVRRFVDAFQAADPYNRPIMIYTAAWFWNAARGFSGNAVNWSLNHPLWVAHYTSDTDPIKPSPTFQVAIPSPWPRYTFHQWTAVGGSLANQNQVPLDLNYFPGSLTELQAWARQGVQPKAVDDVIGTKFVTSEFGLNLRDQPTTGGNILTLMTLGQRVDVLEEGPWDKLRVNGQTGFASSQFLSTENPLGGGAAAEPFAFKVWPTNHKTVTQRFGERPEFYQKISNGFLPGHEGIDLKAPMGSPYFCVAPGKVVAITDQRADGSPSPYGWHIIVKHSDGYSTLYAHATQNFLVNVGDTVAAGQILGHSGNTGNTDAPHLHLTLQKEGHQTPGWPKSYLDPWPFLEPLFNDLKPPMGNLTEGFLFVAGMELRENNLAIAQLNLNMRERPDSSSRLVAKVPPGSVVRLLRTNQENGYLLCEAAVDLEEQPGSVVNFTQPEKLDILAYVRGDGRQYEVRNAQGSQERFQTRVDGLTFYQVKNAQWEQFFVDNDFIYRDIDTSPGGGRYYRLTDPDRTHGSRWLRRKMALGETYTQARNVQFYNKSDGSPSAANSGNVTDTIKLVAHHPEKEMRTGFKVQDVIEIHWVNGPNDHSPREKYFYGRSFGLVGWERAHQDPNSPAWSAVSEVHAPGARPEIPREVVMIR